MRSHSVKWIKDSLRKRDRHTEKRVLQRCGDQVDDPIIVRDLAVQSGGWVDDRPSKKHGGEEEQKVLEIMNPLVPKSYLVQRGMVPSPEIHHIEGPSHRHQR